MSIQLTPIDHFGVTADESRPLARADHPQPDTLRLEGIVKTWRGTGRVLDDVSLTLRAGTAVHLTGQNGCGKTTLMRIAVGLIRAEAGAVSANGLRPDRHRRRYQELVGFLPAGDRALYARMTARDHLRFWARLNFIPRVAEASAVQRAIARFGLEQLADRRVDRMSMGQRQRVRLAGSFLHEPQIVLLDEPRNSLDDEGIDALVAWTTDVVGNGGSVLWCSPNGETTGLEFHERHLLQAGKLRIL